MTNKNITSYDDALASLAELELFYQDIIVTLNSPEEVEDTKAIARKFQKLRTGVEEIRKKANEEAQHHIRKINEEAKVIQARIAPLEDKFALPLKERKARFKKRIQEIDEIVGLCQGKDSEFIGKQLEFLSSINPEHFAEFKKDCLNSLYTANDQLTDMFSDAVHHEQEQKEKEEEARLALVSASINILKALPFDSIGADKETIKMAIETAEGMVIDSRFGATQKEALSVRDAVITQLKILMESAPDSTEMNVPVIDEPVKKNKISSDKEETRSYLLGLLVGDLDTVNLIMHELTKGLIPGVTANFQE